VRKIIGLFVFVSLVLPAAALAQSPQPSGPSSSPAAPAAPTPSYKWFAGGAFGLGFSNVSDYIEFSPLIGYRIVPQFQIGGSITFRYRNDKRFDPDLSTTDFGASLVGRYFVFGPIFLQGEVERIEFEYIERLDEEAFVTRESTYTGLYGGFGFVQGAGRGAVFMSFLWDFNYNDDEPTPQNNPFQIRIGYGIRF
jgi:hypothetical protein